MLLGEPPRTQGDLHFSLLGIPIRVHPLFWLVAVLLNYRLPNFMALAMWVLAVFVGVLFHELGHALMMRAYGFYPWITLYGMGGMATYQPGSSSARGRGHLAQILISAAGPGAGFLLAALLLVGVRLSGNGIVVGLAGGIPYAATLPFSPLPVYYFFNFLLDVSIYWGLLNLLPILPLDGGHIAREVLTAVNPRDGERQVLILSIVVGVLLAAVSLLRLDDFFLALLFGYMAYGNYMSLKAYSVRGF